MSKSTEGMKGQKTTDLISKIKDTFGEHSLTFKKMRPTPRLKPTFLVEIVKNKEPLGVACEDTLPLALCKAFVEANERSNEL